jgi:hypothetical protein
VVLAGSDGGGSVASIGGALGSVVLSDRPGGDEDAAVGVVVGCFVPCKDVVGPLVDRGGPATVVSAESTGTVVGVEVDTDGTGTIGGAFGTTVGESCSRSPQATRTAASRSAPAPARTMLTRPAAVRGRACVIVHAGA